MLILDTITSLFCSDSLSVIQGIVDNSFQDEGNCSNILSIAIDYAYKISMVIIAAYNIYYARKINKGKQQKEEEIVAQEQERRRKEQRIEYLKTLVYDQNLPKLYEFFSSLEEQLLKLKNKDAKKEEIEVELQSLFSNLRSQFILILSAAVPELASKIQDIADITLEKLVSNISDEGINLWVDRYYNDCIKTIFDSCKVKMISVLFEFDGK